MPDRRVHCTAGLIFLLHHEILALLPVLAGTSAVLAETNAVLAETNIVLAETSQRKLNQILALRVRAENHRL